MSNVSTVGSSRMLVLSRKLIRQACAFVSINVQQALQDWSERFVKFMVMLGII